VRVRRMSAGDHRKSTMEGGGGVGGHVRCHYGRQTIGAWELHKIAESVWVRGRGHGRSECAAPQGRVVKEHEGG
jgi:hypothetical protein